MGGEAGGRGLGVCLARARAAGTSGKAAAPGPSNLPAGPATTTTRAVCAGGSEAQGRRRLPRATDVTLAEDGTWMSQHWIAQLDFCPCGL